jgi:hypothetical protein
VEAGPEFKLIAKKKLDGDFLASPAVSGGRIFLRSRTHVYAIGDAGP